MKTLPKIPCTCGLCEAENNYYQCKECQKIAPTWCCGQADEYIDYCDRFVLPTGDRCWHELFYPQILKKEKENF